MAMVAQRAIAQSRSPGAGLHSVAIGRDRGLGADAGGAA